MLRLKKQKQKADDAFKLALALDGTAAVTAANRWDLFFYKYDLEARRAFWQENRAEILKTWIAEKPGTRPFDWWAFDAPGFRQKISATGPGNEHLAEIGGGSDFGIPDYYSDDFEAEQDQPVFESQASFLLRHKLMTQGEQKRLKNADYEPETLK